MAEIPHPEDPPQWLDKWLTESEISERFPEAVRGMAFRAFLRCEHLSVSFTPMSLHATIDNQHAKWRLDDERGWECSCSCKSPVPCMHAYMATIMFRNVCNEEGWQLPKADKALDKANRNSLESNTSEQKTPNSETLSQTKTEAQPMKQLSFFDESYSPNVEKARSSADAPRKTVHRCELECRADFMQSMSSVIVMFRTKENGIVADRRLSWIRECAYELEKGLKSLYEWSDSDGEFLRWILSYLRKVPFERLNGYKWFIPFRDFGVWLQRYPEMTGRMIENRFGRPLGTIMPFCPLTLFLRLSSVPSGVRVECLFRNADGGTTKYHEMRRMESDDRSEFMKSFFKSIFKWPVARSNFYKFENGPMTVLPQNLCEYLRETLDGHYDIIEEGPLVVHERGERVPVSVEVSSNGWSFIVVCHDGMKDAGAASSISLKGGIFHIAVYDKANETMDEMHKVLADLRALAEEFKTRTRGNFRDSTYSCRALPENAVALQEFWRKIPQPVKKTVGDGVEGILGRPACLKLDVSLAAQGHFLSASARCVCGGETMELAELVAAARGNRTLLKSSRGSWFMLDAGEMANAITELNEYGLLDGENVMLPDKAAKMVNSFGKNISVADNSVSIANRLKAQRFPAAPKLPPHYGNVLRPYQKNGFEFLAERSRYGVGTILADDMGLGKTVQMLALLEACKNNSEKRFRAIVVAPASVIDVWLQQTRHFSTGLKAVAMRGTKRQREAVLSKDDYDLLVTHYGLVRTDIDLLSNIDFNLVILDEAQAIKNPEAQITQAVRALKADCRLALTGTPLENRLRDLWSIMDFLNPGLWGTWVDFELKFDSTSGYGRLRKQLRMLMLRRKKENVDLELPPKTVEVVGIEMDDAVRKRYNGELLKARNQADAGGRMGILAALTRLRMFCCAPELVNGCGEVESAKLDYMMEKVSELIESGHSILVFSQFKSMLEIVERRLDGASIHHFKITGETPVEKRGGIVAEFNESKDASVFLLSLKAAGTGLTLTKADYVFMYDPWWNPAAENQAIDRTHRIGQDKPVFAYRLMVKGTVEEKVMQIVEEKRQLFNEVIDDSGASGGDSRLTLDELRGLLD
ncbi:MAG: DEAD/DEAH box helicase [Victivallales bacterium]|nr:DEAD/DEAH box helicase [Victivallales bacterium]